MAFLIVSGERVALQIGDNVLGGRGVDAVEVAALSQLAPFATISVFLEVVTRIRRLSASVNVSVDGEPLGDDPRDLMHGARISSQGLTMAFGDLRLLGSTSRVAGVPDDVIALVSPEGGDIAADTGGVLKAINGNQSYPVPVTGLTIGRDPTCGLVLTSREVSRIHAWLSSSIRGYTIHDRGINGVFVNGVRVDGSRLLARGDVIRIGEDEFRFDADAGSFEPAPELLQRRAVPAPEAPAPPSREGASASTAAAEPSPAAPGGGGPPVTVAPPAPRLMATLEIITEGALRGTRFRIESALAHIGRGDHNPVQLRDSSVSGSHATLLHRAGAWFLMDLDSTNGTYLDGARVTGERRVDGAAEIRVGDVKMIFRPIATPGQASTTRAIVGVTAGSARSRGES